MGESLDLKEKWCYFLRESSALKEEDIRLLSQDRDMEKALRHLEELSRDKELFYKALSQENSEMAYDLNKQGWIEEGIERGIEKGIERGREEGIEIGREEGIERGIEKGIEKGIERGMEKGREEGMEKGREEGMEKGREEGIEKGREEGRETNKKNIALKMLKEGLDKAFISKITNLSEAEIIRLKNQED